MTPSYKLDQDAMRRILDRLTLAGWTTGYNFDDNKLVVHWTPEGLTGLCFAKDLFSKTLSPLTKRDQNAILSLVYIYIERPIERAKETGPGA